jgi:hypothetical protein
MSNFFYIHKELSGQADVWKIGISITPYSAVRLRQRFLAKRFELDKVYFGRGRDIKTLEDTLKRKLEYCAIGNYGQRELFKIKFNDLENMINDIIENLDIEVDNAGKSYSASSSGICPLGAPTEHLAGAWCSIRVMEKFGRDKALDIFDSTDFKFN